MSFDTNPFTDPDQAALWEMLVFRDIGAFSRADWDAHAADFLTDGFMGISAGKSEDSTDWALAFPDLETYRENWLSGARGAQGRIAPDALRRAHFEASHLHKIDVNGDFAICHKHFDGTVTYDDGSVEELNWRTLYFCRKKNGRWWISGFIGFMKNT